MMSEQVLHAERRTKCGSASARQVRRAGRLPVVLYGHKEDTVALTVPSAEFEAVLRSGARMVDVDVDGRAEKALVKEVQFDALGDVVLHADLVRVAMDETVEVTVPIELHGTAAGVKEGGGLDQLLHEVTVTCLPENIPESIRVRVDDMDIGRTLHLRDVDLPLGVKPVGDPETPVATVHPPMGEVEAVPAEEEAAPAAPEVIGKGPREEEPEDRTEG